MSRDSADHLERLLRAQNGFCLRLRELVAKLDWTGADAVDCARSDAIQIVRENLYFWRKRRRAYGVSRISLVRNLVAAAPADVLQVLRLVLRWAVERETLSERSAFEEIVAAIPRKPGIGALLEDLLLEHATPRVAVLLELGLVPIETFPEILDALEPPTVSFSRNELHDWILSFPKEVWVLENVVRVWRRFELPRLAREDLDRLPYPTTYDLLADTSFQEELLAPEFRSELEEDPLSHPLTPESQAWAESLESAHQAIIKLERTLRSAKPRQATRVLEDKRARGDASQLALALSALIRSDRPDRDKILRHGLSPTRLQCDARAASLLRAEEAQTYLASLPWCTALAELARREAPAPAAFVALVTESGPEHLPLAALLHPEAFGAAAIETCNLEALLPRALRSWKLAKLVEKIVPLQAIRERRHLAEELARTPYEQVAFEIAICFGLSHARYLLHLARRWADWHQLTPAERTSSPFDDLYHVYEIPKRRGGRRQITAPEDRLKFLQRSIVETGFLEIPNSEPTHGFRRNRSIRTNALPHVGHEMVVNVDIKSFFPSTPQRVIRDVCFRLLDGELSARSVLFVADICSYGGALPAGAPTSPYIANLALSRFDSAIEKAVARHNIKYTRYADDLTFSGAAGAQRILPFVERLLGEIGFELDKKKTGIFRRGRRQVVTGVVVNDQANLPRRFRRNLRAAVHQRGLGREATWHGRPASDAAIEGRIALLNMFSAAEAAKLRAEFERARE